jgi:hypothetical protein
MQFSPPFRDFISPWSVAIDSCIVTSGQNRSKTGSNNTAGCIGHNRSKTGSNNTAGCIGQNRSKTGSNNTDSCIVTSGLASVLTDTAILL